MILELKRIAKKENYTIGKLYINGKYECDTLEDKDRGLNDNMELKTIRSIKVYGKTAIPVGRYHVALTYSPKYQKEMPLIEGVKGFEGIRIHSGNVPEDTLGCILVGENKVKGKVINSRATYEKLYNKLKNSKDDIYLVIS